MPECFCTVISTELKTRVEVTENTLCITSVSLEKYVRFMDILYPALVLCRGLKMPLMSLMLMIQGVYLGCCKRIICCLYYFHLFQVVCSKKKRVSVVPLTGILESYNSRNKMFFKPDFRESKTQYRRLDHVKLKQVTSFILK